MIKTDKKSYEILLAELNPEQLVEAFIFPAGNSLENDDEAKKMLSIARSERMAKMTDGEKQHARLMQFKIKISKYLDMPDEKAIAISFAGLFNEYLDISNRKLEDFCLDIEINIQDLKRILDFELYPDSKMLIRFELHSGHIINAADWYRVYERARVLDLLYNNNLRKTEKKHVHWHFGIPKSLSQIKGSVK